MDIQTEKILALDFDHTINKINLSMRIHLAFLKEDKPVNFLASKILDNLDQKEVLSELFQESSFLEYLRRLKKTKKVKIIVTSFGFHDAIVETLNRYKLSDIFDEVITPISFGYEDGYEHFGTFRGKNMMLEYAMKKYHITDKKSVLLLDDSRINMSYANRENFPIIRCEKDGLKKDHGKMILKYMRICC
jgi:FMN phosphatase YigB (HAD superfamily)